MPNQLTMSEFQTLKLQLPVVFHNAFKPNDEQILINAYPLLNMMCSDRELIEKLASILDLPYKLTFSSLQTNALYEKLENNFNSNALFFYRLPILLSEYPIHSRPINSAIQRFNRFIEELTWSSNLLQPS